MAYLGNSPARSFISFERQVFTIVNSQTAYTLSHSVANENDIRLVVNNVVQEPGSGKAYTATGTALTLSAALTNGTDEMYCVFLGRAVETVKPPAGSVGTSQLASDAVTNAKIADDAISDEQLDPTVITGQTAETSIATDDLILLSDTSASGALKKMTRANFVSGVGETNTPYFYAEPTGSSQVFTHNVNTKMVFNNEIFDSANAYDTSTYRFTTQTAGKYFVFLRISGTCTNNNDLYMDQSIRKNGTQVEQLVGIQEIAVGDFQFGSLTAMIEMNGSSDYIEAWAYFYNYTTSGNSASVYGGAKTKFGAYLVSTT